MFAKQAYSKGYPGFESLSLRKKESKCKTLGFFIGFNRSSLRIEGNKKTKQISARNFGFHALQFPKSGINGVNPFELKEIKLKLMVQVTLMKKNRKVKHSFYPSTLICLLMCISFANRTFSQESYWERIHLAEDLFVLGAYESSLTNYCATFEKYGVCQLSPWMNAYKISEVNLNGKYSETLLNFLIKEDNLYYLKKAKSKYEYLDGMVDIPLLDTLKRSSFKESIKNKKIARSSWLKLARKDQRPRKFPKSIFISDDKLWELDSINREGMMELCVSNNNLVPSKMDLFYFGSFDYYYSIFENSHLSSSASNWNKMDSIFYNSIKYGKYSPKFAQYNLINSVMFDMRRSKQKEYENSTDLAQDWFRITKFSSKEEAESTIGISRFRLINNLRELIYLEPITNQYLRKRTVFKEQGLAVQ